MGGWGKNVQILDMMLAKELFIDLVRKVEKSGQFNFILKKQQNKYQLQPFKLQGIDCRAIKRIYQALWIKYFETHQLTQDPHNWNENQRRVFIWYIIFYTYFLAQNNQQLNHQHWRTLSTIFFNKKEEFLQFQYLSMIKPCKITWTQEEDRLLTQSVKHQGAGRWNEVAKYFFFTSKYTIFKSPKHCRQRWLNHLDDKKKHGQWTPEEDLIIFNYVIEHGKRWCKLVTILNDSRTEHMIKNRYNSLVNKQKVFKKEREQISLFKIRKMLKKQIENNQRKKQKKEEQGMLKLSQIQKSSKIDQEQVQQQEGEKDIQKSLVKVEEIAEASFEGNVIQIQKTNQAQNVEEKTLKEQSEVDYIMHQAKQQKSNTDQSQNSLKVKVEEKQSKNCGEYGFQYNTYPFMNLYNGLGYMPGYPYYWA